MTLRFVVGRSGSGKSTYVMNQIRQRLQEAPQGSPLVLIVPEQVSFQAEQWLMEGELKGAIRAQVLSFRRLAHRILQEVGGAVGQPIDENGKLMLLYRTIEEEKDKLTSLQGQTGRLGFMEQMLALFDEFRRYQISASSLEEKLAASGQAPDKLRDIAHLYHAFDAALAQTYMDGEEVLHMLGVQLAQSDYLRTASVWIDGFSGFTPLEMQVIDQLLLHCPEVEITLSLDRTYEAGEKPYELALFHPTARTMSLMRTRAQDNGVTELPPVRLYNDGSESRRFRHSQLQHLERHYATRTVCTDVQLLEDHDAIRVHGASSRRLEVEALIAQMMRLVREEGYRWRDLMILVRNLDDYEGYLSEKLRTHDIPYFLDQKRPITQHPFIEWIRSALEVVVYGWRYDDIFRCVKSQYLLIPTTDTQQERRMREELDHLENYALAYGLQGFRWRTNDPWTFMQARSLDDDEDDEQADEEGAATDAILDDKLVEEERIHWLRMLVSRPLAKLEQGLSSATNVQQMVLALYQMIEECQAVQRLEQQMARALEAGHPEQAQVHAQVWERFVDVLDQLSEIAGTSDISVEGFKDLLDSGLSSIQLALVPPALDQVLIGNLDHTRSPKAAACFILGLNDGILPKRFEDTGMLNESERDWMRSAGVELAPDSRRRLLDEQYLVYTVLSQARDHLWLSYALADEEGRSLQPSEIIRRVRVMFPSITESSDDPTRSHEEEEQQFLARLVHPRQALVQLGEQLTLWKTGRLIHKGWWSVYDWLITHPDYRLQLDRTLHGLFYTNDERPLEMETSRLLYGDTLQASVSRMETFAACPFSQFIAYGLRLRERKVYRLEAPDIGQLFHAALRMIAGEIMAQNRSWGDFTEEELMQKASDAVDRLAPRLGGQILFSSSRFAYIARKLKMIVGRASVVLGEHARRGDFVPVGIEVGFGADEMLPPLVFDLPHGFSMKLRGRIDRVDRAYGEQGMLLRVIDYKSGRTSLQLTDLYYGLSLQMLAYLDVVVTHAAQWLGQPAKPAGVLYFHVHNPLITSNNPLAADKLERELLRQYKMKGYLLEDAEVIRMMDRSLNSGHSDIVPAGLKSDGGFYHNSAVADEQRWGHLRRHTRRKMQQIGQQIVEGHVEIEPYRLGKRLPCDYCDYRAICQFDPLFEGNAYRNLRPLAKDEVWRQLEEEEKGGEQYGSN